jgi:hypothetical protein
MIAPRPRAARGQRPYHLADPDCERLLTMVVALTGEISVLQDRFDTLSQLAASGQPFSEADLARHVPSQTQLAARAARREALVDRVFRILLADAERAGHTSVTYDDVVAQLADPKAKV